jgi:hypothetical protein
MSAQKPEIVPLPNKPNSEENVELLMEEHYLMPYQVLSKYSNKARVQNGRKKMVPSAETMSG